MKITKRKLPKRLNRDTLILSSATNTIDGFAWRTYGHDPKTGQLYILAEG